MHSIPAWLVALACDFLKCCVCARLHCRIPSPAGTAAACRWWRVLRSWCGQVRGGRWRRRWARVGARFHQPGCRARHCTWVRLRTSTVLSSHMCHAHICTAQLCCSELPYCCATPTPCVPDPIDPMDALPCMTCRCVRGRDGWLLRGALCTPRQRAARGRRQAAAAAAASSQGRRGQWPSGRRAGGGACCGW